MNSLPPSAFGLLITRNLFFASKVTGTAGELGLHVEVVGSIEDAHKRATRPSCRCLLIDLAVPGGGPLELLAGFPESDRPAVIAFGAHVHTGRLQQARDAGCDEVLPRSRFSADLPQLLTRYLGDA